MSGARGEPPSIRALVGELVAQWRRDARVDCYAPYLLLERAHVQLEKLPSAELAILEEVTKDLRPALAALLDDVRGTRAPHRRRLRDLNTLARRLACTAVRLSSDPRPEASLAVTYARIDLAPRVRVLAHAFEALAHERDIAYVVASPASVLVETDPERADLVVLTLLFNAFEHTPRRGSIRCELKLDPRAGEIVIRVEDSGPSVSLETSDQMFHPLRQSDRSVRVFAGAVAIDLGSSRDSVALLGGTLQVDPRTSRGATFEVRVPQRALGGVPVVVGAAKPVVRHELAERVAARARLELKAQETLHLRPVPRDGRPLVLIVEDSQPLHRILVEALEPEHATVSAFDGATALDRALRLGPDLTLIDLGLPVMEGEAVIRALRDHGELARHPVVVLTGRDDERRIERLFELGVRDVWRKPFYIPELTARVRALISEKRARETLAAALGTHEHDLFRLAEDAAKRQQLLLRVMEDLEEARANAETASQIKGNFLRMMSHELKTPITAIQLHARMLERQADQASAPSMKDPAERIARSSRRLGHLVDAFMEWARVESGRIELAVEEVSLPTLVDEVLAETSSAASQKGLVLAVDSPPGEISVATDRRIVRLVVRELVTRAVQVTASGRVAVAVERDPSDGCRVLVHDMAEPIAQADADELFDPLRPGEELDRRSGPGSGLGLHAVRDIAAAIEAGLELRTTPQGNTLVLSLRPLPRDRTTSRIRKALMSETRNASTHAPAVGDTRQG